MARRKKAMPDLTYEEYEALCNPDLRNILDMKAHTKRFGLMLRRLREQKGFSIQEVQDQTTYSASYLYQVERGDRKIPSTSMMYELARLYEVPLDSLMAAAKHMVEDDVILYHQLVAPAFHVVCQDKIFKFGFVVDEEAVPDDVKRLVVEMYQHFTGKKLLEQVDEQMPLREQVKRKLRGEDATVS